MILDLFISDVTPPLFVSQMGLLLDLAPDADLDDSGGNDAGLEAELLALMGGGGKGRVPRKKESGKGKNTDEITFFLIYIYIMIHFF